MSASSGISASQSLIDDYTKVVEDNSIRFLKVAIENGKSEKLIPNGSWAKKDEDMSSDLAQLSELLEDKVPAYVLARLDSGPNDWLFISYVPDNAKVRDKMLYASSRSALTKALGGQAVKDTIFATNKSDVTPTAYAAHLRHIAAPQPLSAREAELAEIQAAERQSNPAFEGSRGRKNHVGNAVGLEWAPEVEGAVKAVVADGADNLVVLSVDATTEIVRVIESRSTTVQGLASALPTGDPSYSFFRWQPGKIIFIYACPSTSKVKMRMIYSSGVTGVVQMAQKSAGFKVFKKLETSDPSDLDLSFAEEQSAASSSQVTGPPSFARPRGPPRKR